MLLMVFLLPAKDPNIEAITESNNILITASQFFKVLFSIIAEAI